MRHRRWTSVWPVLSLLVSVTPQSYAQNVHSANNIEAQAAFEEGQSLMSQNAYAQACAKFAESQRLEPGIGTLLWLGECFEKSGKVASAFRAFEQAASLAHLRGDDREALAISRSARLDPDVPRLTLHSLRRDLRVRLNGVDWPLENLDVAERADPGEYSAIVTRDVNGVTSRQTWVLSRGQRITIDLDRTDLSIVSTKVVDQPAAPSFWTTRRFVGVGLLGGGLAAAGVGLGLGFAARGTYADTAAQCAPKCTDREAFQKRENAFALSHVATALIIGGLVTVVVGSVLTLWPRSVSSAPNASERSRSVSPSVTP
jgi:tetratricopeptide (TPR) repeat protein